MVITIVVDHPLDVPLSPAHLLFFLAFPFPFEPALHPKARAQVGGLALKGDLIDRLLLATTSIPCCNRRVAGTKRETLRLSFLFPTLFLTHRDGYSTRMSTPQFGFHMKSL
jgi:hypothetical protein